VTNDPKVLADAIERAAATIRDGGLVAYPTEAVFGLGCDPTRVAAVERLLLLKRRSRDKGLILIAAAFDQLASFLDPLQPAQMRRIEQTWPGPATWLMPASHHTSALLRGNHKTLAVRVTAHPVAAELCRRAGGALVSTSANVAGGPPAANAAQVRRIFGDNLDFVLDAPVGSNARPTQIRDAISGEVVRAG
jgi:L-threonylcarbamoyladenylate synthase